MLQLHTVTYMTAHPKYQVLNTGRAKSLNTQEELAEEETEYRLS